MSKKKIIKLTIICVVFAALLAGLIAMMVTVKADDYGNPDALEIGASNFGGRLLTGLQVAVLGIGTVFVMLILLILVVTLMRLIFEGAGRLKEKQVAKKAIASQSAPVIEEKVACGDDGEDEEVVAVIMAALNAYYETQNATYKSNLKFRVRSIKEI